MAGFTKLLESDIVTVVDEKEQALHITGMSGREKR